MKPWEKYSAPDGPWAKYQQEMGGDGRAGKVKAIQDADKAEFAKLTADQPFYQNLAEGIGQGMTSAVRAVGGGRIAGALGLPSTKEEAAAIDAPLLETWGGKIGQAVGIAAPASLAIPFTPAGAVGAIGAGALTGAALTEGGVGDRALAAGFGGAGAGVAQALPSVYRAGKGVVRGLTEPLTDAGRQRIAGRAIERFATNPNALAGLTNDASETGARLTLAEATRDPGLATLQRAIGTMDPEASVMLGARAEANNAARLNALSSLTGDAQMPRGVRKLNQIAYGQPTREVAEAARAQAAAKSYKAAFDAGIDPDVAEMMWPQIKELLVRPSVVAGKRQAEKLANEEGINLVDATSVQGLHYLKMALDDQAEKLIDQPVKRRLVIQTAKDLSSVLDELSPAYQAARREFQYNSVPVNRAAIGERLYDKTTGDIKNFGGDLQLRANAFSRSLNDEEKLIAQSTGFKGNKADLADVLTATQLGKVGAIRNELETLANLSNAANGPGSQTAKMLASQNMLRQIAGPMGVPDSWIESVLSQTAMRPVQWALKSAEPKIGAAVAKGLLDPGQAQNLLSIVRAYDARKMPNELEKLLRGRVAPALIGSEAARK
jgi:hypothetical protein